MSERNQGVLKCIAPDKWENLRVKVDHLLIDCKQASCLLILKNKMCRCYNLVRPPSSNYVRETQREREEEGVNGSENEAERIVLY